MGRLTPLMVGGALALVPLASPASETQDFARWLERAANEIGRAHV